VLQKDVLRSGVLRDRVWGIAQTSVDHSSLYWEESQHVEPYSHRYYLPLRTGRSVFTVLQGSITGT
jgi:hypothetical protein